MKIGILNNEYIYFIFILYIFYYIIFVSNKKNFWGTRCVLFLSIYRYIARTTTISAILRFGDIWTSVLYPEHIWRFLSNPRNSVSCSLSKIALIFRYCHTPIARFISEEVDILFTTSENTHRGYFENRLTAETIMDNLVMLWICICLLRIGIAYWLNSSLSHQINIISYKFLACIL